MKLPESVDHYHGREELVGDFQLHLSWFNQLKQSRSFKVSGKLLGEPGGGELKSSEKPAGMKQQFHFNVSG